MAISHAKLAKKRAKKNLKRKGKQYIPPQAPKIERVIQPNLDDLRDTDVLVL